MRPEILAPASSFDMVRFAVQNGANAVYLGLKEFNARRNAGNFTLDELRSAIGFCHIRGVSVYLTVNIIVKDSELETACELVKDAYLAGIDAAIVSDIGLAAILRNRFPELELHASTQLSIHNLDGVKKISELGFSRVCLARELSLKEISQIRDGSDIELEVFVHGAHCMSVSGQCYFSALIGSRSGNRGLCGQVCRLPFKNGVTDHALSLKDMSIIDRLPQLSEIGVTSFKIEGRMKRPEYVAAAVAACKASLDGSSDFEEKFGVLEKVFSRSGFTSAYFDNNRTPDMFGVRRKEDIADEGLLKRIRNSQKEVQLLPVKGKYTLRTGEKDRFTLCDGKNEVTVEGQPPQIALSKPIDEKSALENLSKLGGTPYYMTDFEFISDGNCFVGRSHLNNLRREAVDRLNSARSAVRPRRINEYDFSHIIGHTVEKQTLLLTFENAEQIPICAKRHECYLSFSESENTFSKLINEGYDIGVSLPDCSFKNDSSILKKLESLKAIGVKRTLCNNLYAVEVSNRCGLEITAGRGLNLFNSYAVKEAESLGAAKSLLSFELTRNEINAINSANPVGILAYGRLPLMTMRACPIMRRCSECSGREILTDRLGNRFTVLCKGEYRQLLNNVPIAVKSYEAFKADFLQLDFTVESRKEADFVITAFERGEKLSGEYTNGLYSRGVM